MSIEIKYLAWSIALGIVYVLVAATLGTAQRGLNWNVGNRDADTKPLTGAAARAHRASPELPRDLSLLCRRGAGRGADGRPIRHRRRLGAMLYFWARTLYLPVYVIGIPYLRTLVWAVSFVGLLMLLTALL